jgi:hypothetical protein
VAVLSKLINTAPASNPVLSKLAYKRWRCVLQSHPSTFLRTWVG